MLWGSKFSYESAKLRARLAQKLSKEKFATLLKSKNLEEAVQHLRGTYYEIFYESYTKTGYLSLAELAIKKREIDTLLGIRSGFWGAERNLIGAFLYTYEIENLKDILAIWFNSIILKRMPLKQEVFLRQTILNPIPYERLLNASDFHSVIDCLKETPYASVLEPYADECRSNKTLFYFFAALDIYQYSHLKLAVNNLDARDRLLASRFFGTEIDFENMLAQLRYKDAGMDRQEALRYFIPGGSHLHIDNIADVLQNPQAVRTYLKKTYHQIDVKIPQDIHLMREVELYRNAVMGHLAQIMRMADPLSIALVIAYFYWIREEEHLVISLLEGTSFGMDEKAMEEALCLSQLQ